FGRNAPRTSPAPLLSPRSPRAARARSRTASACSSRRLQETEVAHDLDLLAVEHQTESRRGLVADRAAARELSDLGERHVEQLGGLLLGDPPRLMVFRAEIVGIER